MISCSPKESDMTEVDLLGDQAASQGSSPNRRPMSKQELSVANRIGDALAVEDR